MWTKTAASSGQSFILVNFSHKVLPKVTAKKRNLKLINSKFVKMGTVFELSHF